MQRSSLPIHYFYFFKPDETKLFNLGVIAKNSDYARDYNIITPGIIDTLVENETNTFPSLKRLYHKIPRWIIKTDIGRLLYVFANGGIYCDVDCFIDKSIFKNTNHTMGVFIEKIINDVSLLGPRELKTPECKIRIANYFFFSKVKRHLFLKKVIEECLVRLEVILDVYDKEGKIKDEDVLWCCGPDVITTVYHREKNNFESIYLYDMSYVTHKDYHSWK